MRYFLVCVLAVSAVVVTLGCSEKETAIETPVMTSAGNTLSTAEVGAVKADSGCNGSDSCFDQDKEDGTIAASDEAIAWINGAGGFCGTYYYEIFNNGAGLNKVPITTGTLAFSTDCGGSPGQPDQYRRYIFTSPNIAPGRSDQVLMVVHCGSNASAPIVGSDSFRVRNNGNCFK